MTNTAYQDQSYRMIRENGITVFPLEAVKEACDSGEVSQKEIANRAGIPEQTVSALLNRKTGKTYRKAIKLYEALEAIRADKAAAAAEGGEG